MRGARCSVVWIMAPKPGSYTRAEMGNLPRNMECGTARQRRSSESPATGPYAARQRVLNQVFHDTSRDLRLLYWFHSGLDSTWPINHNASALQPTTFARPTETPHDYSTPCRQYYLLTGSAIFPLYRPCRMIKITCVRCRK